MLHSHYYGSPTQTLWYIYFYHSLELDICKLYLGLLVPEAVSGLESVSVLEGVSILEPVSGALLNFFRVSVSHV